MDTLTAFLVADFLGKPAWVWLTFVGIVVALLAWDLGVLHKDDKEIGVRDSLLLSAGYTSAWRCSSAPGCGGSWARKAAWPTTPAS